MLSLQNALFRGNALMDGILTWNCTHRYTCGSERRSHGGLKLLLPQIVLCTQWLWLWGWERAGVCEWPCAMTREIIRVRASFAVKPFLTNNSQVSSLFRQKYHMTLGREFCSNAIELTIDRRYIRATMWHVRQNGATCLTQRISCSPRTWHVRLLSSSGLQCLEKCISGYRI